MKPNISKMLVCELGFAMRNPTYEFSWFQDLFVRANYLEIHTLIMSNLTELLNQIDRWVWQYNSNAAIMSPGLSLSEIQTKLDLLPFELPSEVIELYQWRNGGQYSFLPCPEGGYDLQNFLSLDDAISIAQDLNRAKSTYDFPLFYLEDILYWTQGSSDKQKLAVIYCHHNSSKPEYPSLTAMMERELERLRTIWLVD